MAIWLKPVIIGVAAFLSSSSRAQELLNIPVAIPAVSPAATTFVVARDCGYFREQRAGTVAILTKFMRIREDMAGKIYDVVRPGVTQDGTVSEELQRRSIEHVVSRAALKEAPRLERIFDNSVLLRVRQELQTKGWKP